MPVVLSIDYGTNIRSVTKQLNYEIGQQQNKVWNRQKKDKEMWVAMLFHLNLCKYVHKLGLLTHWLAGLWIYHTWKSGKNQGYFGWHTNCIAPQSITLESCSNPQKTWQVFKSAMKKNLWFWVSVLLWVTSYNEVGFSPFLAACVTEVQLLISLFSINHTLS